jgi:ABC-type uncharacterized transport system ATPase subunit
MVEFNRDEMLTRLRDSAVNLSFEKVKDGQIREMTATLNMGMIPEDKMPKGGTVDQSVGGNETLRVFDVDIQEWRSFRIDKLLSFG